MTEDAKILPFHQALLNADFEKIEEFFNNGTDINQSDENGRNSIYYAIFSENLDILKWVIGKGADINYVCPIDGNSLLHLAAGEGRLDMVQYLIREHHFDVNALNRDGETPLSCSMIFTQMELACYLIEKGAVKIGKIPNAGALLKYIKYKITRLKRRKTLKNKEPINKRISVLQSFLKCNSPKAAKPENYKEINAEVEKVLINIGIKKGKELFFYKRHLEYAEKQQLISLYNKNQKDKKIRNIIWKCYLSNHITMFHTSCVIKPAYTISFNRGALLPDCRTGSELDMSSFIKDIPSFLPKFGIDYYLNKNKKFSTWMSLNTKNFDTVIEDVNLDRISLEQQNYLQCIFMRYTLSEIELIELNDQWYIL